MSRSRPASNPLSHHKPTGQYYVTRGKKRVYLGADRDEALVRYHRMELGMSPTAASPGIPDRPVSLLTAKELANRFLAAQQANWRAPEQTLRSYKDWLGRFLKDHPRLRAAEFTVEMFAAWKVSLRKRKYSAPSINHYMTAVRSMFAFAEDAVLLEQIPKLKRVKNETLRPPGSEEKPIYTMDEIHRLLKHADIQLKVMILFGLNCGFGPKDIRDLTWRHITDNRVTLARSKTGVCQTFLIWPETLEAIEELRLHRETLIARLAKRGRQRSDDGSIFITRFWRPWGKDSVAEQFRRLCGKANVTCHGFYRLRHCASTAISLVTTPHVQRKFMRHTKLQQQVTYTHAPNSEVEDAIMKARDKLLGGLRIIEGPKTDREQTVVA
jgi:integrase